MQNHHWVKVVFDISQRSREISIASTGLPWDDSLRSVRLFFEARPIHRVENRAIPHPKHIGV